MMSARLYKIWNSTRETKKIVVAQSLEDLLQKATDKLALTGKARAVLEADGTEIEDDDVLSMLTKDDVIMVLDVHQQWEGVSSVITVNVEDKEQSQATEVEASAQECQGKIQHAESAPASQSSNKLPLPAFSEYVKGKLASNESHLVWPKLIGECAYHYITVWPGIGLDNSSADYRDIGRQLYAAYPCIGRDGAHPWSFFTGRLSQKIRRIRWDNKRRSAPTSIASGATPSPKRSRVVPAQDSSGEECDAQSYDSHVKEMENELQKKEPSITHMKVLMKATLPHRRQWIQQLPPGSVQPILEKFPCFKNPIYIMAELRYLLQVSTLVDVIQRSEAVFKAVSSLKKVAHDATGLAVLKALESETAYRQGKGQRTKSIVQIVKLEGENVERLLSSPEKSAPMLIAISKEEKVVNMAIVCDKIYILLDTSDTVEAMIVLLGMYYLTDFEYPKVYSQVLGFLQQTIFQQQYEGRKTSGFIQFMKRVSAEMEK